MEKLNFNEFDIMGIFELSDANGIEELVTPIKNGKYLSRNGNYYTKRTYTDLSKEREQLKQKLTTQPTRRNFVIVENMLNASSKIYFEELQKKILGQYNNLDKVQECMQEDCDNIIKIFENKDIIKPIKTLPYGEDMTTDRVIEMDNKLLLYLYSKCLNFSKPKHVIIPGLGAILIGPFLKSLYGFDYTNILLSKYARDKKLQSLLQMDFQDLMSNNEWKNTQNDILLLDDNIATARTINYIKQELEKYGKKCRYGAIKYNWLNFYNARKGLTELATFDISKVDLLSIFDDPGYWIGRDAANNLKKSGDEYIEGLKREGFRKENISDTQIMINMAEKYAELCNVDIYATTIDKERPTRSSTLLCRKLKAMVNEIERETELDER